MPVRCSVAHIRTPAEIAVHPTDGAPEHQLYHMCEDIEATITELRAKGITFTQAVRDENWGRVTAIALPGGGELGLYQPRHPTALELPSAAKAVRGKTGGKTGARKRKVARKS